MEVQGFLVPLNTKADRTLSFTPQLTQRQIELSHFRASINTI